MPTATARTRPDRLGRTGLAGPRRTRAWRWLAVFVAVTVLHWFAAEWVERHRGVPPPVGAVHVPVQVALLKAERVEREAKPGQHAAPAAPRAPVHPAHRAAPDAHALHAITPPRPHPKVSAQPPASSPAVDSASEAAASAPASSANSADTANTGHAQNASGNGDNPSAPSSAASHGVKFSVPPSGDLQYDTFYNGVRNEPGTIHWSSNGDHYEMVVSVPLPFIGTFSWTSRGHVDAFGLAPDQYIEKRGRRAPDVTTFDHNDKQITFSRTPQSLALPDAAQDRFSMVMQLASLVRGDPGAYRPGVTREFYVADNDSGEVWPVTTIGDETVSTAHGYVTARHFMRLPRRDGDKRRIDVWLAQSVGWLPVRLVQTEPNGTQFELVWRGALAAPDQADAAKSADEAASPAPNATSGQPAASPSDSTAAPSADAPTEAPAVAPTVPPTDNTQTNDPSDAPMHP